MTSGRKLGRPSRVPALLNSPPHPRPCPPLHTDLLSFWPHSGFDEATWANCLTQLSLDLLTGLLMDLDVDVVSAELVSEAPLLPALAASLASADLATQVRIDE